MPKFNPADLLEKLGTTVLTFETREEWLEARKGFLTASDAAVILGESPYSSKYALAQEKLGYNLAPVEADYLEAGRRMEPVIAQWFEDETGYATFDPGTYALVTNPKHPWLAATLDRVAIGPGKSGEVRVLELKNPNAFKLHEWEEDVPFHFHVQNQVQMLCTGLCQGAIASIVGGRHFRYLMTERHDALCKHVLKETETFWKDIQDGVVPEPDGHPATGEALKSIYPEGEPERIPLPQEFDELMVEFERLREDRKALDGRFDEIKHKVEAVLGDAHEGYTPNGKWTWKPQGGNLKKHIEVERAEVEALEAAGIRYKDVWTPRFRVLRCKRKGG